MDIPIYRTVQRTWFHRLFTWPWRPWVKTVQVRDSAAELRRDMELIDRILVDAANAARARREEKRSQKASPPWTFAPPPGEGMATRPRAALLGGRSLDIETVLAASSIAHSEPLEWPKLDSGGGGSYAGGGASGSWDSSSSSDSGSSSSGGSD